MIPNKTVPASLFTVITKQDVLDRKFFGLMFLQQQVLHINLSKK